MRSRAVAIPRLARGAFTTPNTPHTTDASGKSQRCRSGAFRELGGRSPPGPAWNSTEMARSAN
eukprot:15480304-Alexandrium_andersonii.AAC.1